MCDVFGFLASGRLLRTDFTQVDSTHFVLSVVDAESLNHIAVFLTGTNPFPEGTAGLVYFSWSKNTEPNEWKLLGSISNAKPSAIFKISYTKPTDANEIANGLPAATCVAQVGISIEPIDVVEQQTTLIASNSYSNPSVALEFTKKMLVNFFNYASSFIISAEQLKQSLVDNIAPNYIPLNVLETWYSNFERKLMMDPNFWKK